MACIGVSQLFTVNPQVITKCFPSIDRSNTSTLLTERPEIPEHCKAFNRKRFPLTWGPSSFDWLNSFPIPRNHYWSLLLESRPQAHWMSGACFLPRILPLSGWTQHSINTSQLQSSLPIILPKSTFCLNWDPLLQVRYSQQQSKAALLPDYSWLLGVLDSMWNLSLLPLVVWPSRPGSTESDHSVVGISEQMREAHQASHRTGRNHLCIQTTPFWGHS